MVSTKWASFKDYLGIITNHGQAFHEHSVFLFILIFGTEVPHSVYYISYYKGTSFTSWMAPLKQAFQIQLDIELMLQSNV